MDVDNNRQVDWLKVLLIVCSFGLALIAVVGYARADTLGGKGKVAAPTQTAAPRTWTGIYGGGYGMYGTGEVSFPGSPVGLSTTGPMAGVNAGVTVQTGQIVWGAEIAHTWMFGNPEEVGLNREIEYTGRLGVPIGNALLYAHGSFAQLDVDGLGTIEGWKFGPGVELKTSVEGWSVDLRGGYAVYDVEAIAPGVDANMLWGRVGLVRRFDLPVGWFGQ
jgi:hypothetical protein